MSRTACSNSLHSLSSIQGGCHHHGSTPLTTGTLPVPRMHPTLSAPRVHLLAVSEIDIVTRARFVTAQRARELPAAETSRARWRHGSAIGTLYVSTRALGSRFSRLGPTPLLTCRAVRVVHGLRSKRSPRN